ncbi:MAG: PAS domain S-box protein [Syntrophorhabdales bacterium]
MAAKAADKATSKFDELRHRAEEQLAKVRAQVPKAFAEDVEDMQRLLHELNVTQIELEMQNEALRTSETELEASRSRYAELYDFAPVGYLTLNRAGFIQEINLMACTILGHERRSARNRPFFRFIAPEHRVTFEKYLAAAFRTGVRQTCELKLTGQRSSTWIAMDSQCGPAQDETGRVCRAVIVDITQSRLAEAERVRLIAAVDQAAEAIIVTDPQTAILYANPAACEITGYSRAELIGRRADAKSLMQHGQAYEKMWSRLQLGLSWSGRITNRKKDGTLYSAEMSIAPVTGLQSEIVNYVVVFRDATDQIAMEARLRESQKLEAIGTLAGGIAHDFNNILAAIIGFTQMATDDAEKGSRQERDLKHVLKAGIRGRDLVKQILAFSRKSQSKKSLLRVSALIEESLKLLRATLPSTLTIHSNVVSESGFVLGDPTQLQQVIINLCTNAAHAMREKGGVVSVELSDFGFSAAGEAPVPDLAPGAYLKLTVKDTGEGIPREHLDRIFEPFFTTKKPGEGSGLGLAVAHGIAESHGGAITVASEPGKGSTFTVYLPKDIEAQAEKVPEEAGLATGHERILFIDDEEALAEMGEQMLIGLGYQAVRKTSSREALALFRLDPSKFDLVVTDQTMPEMTGIQLAGEILTLRPNMPIILCTGYSHEVDADSAVAAGIRAFLEKPLTKNEIARTVRRVLDEKR